MLNYIMTERIMHTKNHQRAQNVTRVLQDILNAPIPKLAPPVQPTPPKSNITTISPNVVIWRAVAAESQQLKDIIEQQKRAADDDGAPSSSRQRLDDLAETCATLPTLPSNQ
jgi:hypothetical protein